MKIFYIYIYIDISVLSSSRRILREFEIRLTTQPEKDKREINLGEGKQFTRYFYEDIIISSYIYFIIYIL